MQTTHELIADPVSLHLDVMREIRRQLSPYHGTAKPITGRTVICDGSLIDSLTMMDVFMELEDRFEVSLPIKAMTEIHTVDELVLAILKLRAAR